jgi:HD superfamily phosphohydrolase YqeK
MPRSRSVKVAGFPVWAEASKKRRAHVERVVALLERWAEELHVPTAEANAWRAAGYLHDALRDAPKKLLRAMTRDKTGAAEYLHGPAAAIRARADGERRENVLDAVRFHTVGCATWKRTGRALYMADFLEPGRKFLVDERAFLADQVAHDFSATFRQVVRLRLEWSMRQGGELFPESVKLWHAVR